MIRRRDLLGSSMTLAGAAAAAGIANARDSSPVVGRGLVDTNVSLFGWPFRRLPLDATGRLVAKLASLGVVEAWAGSFEPLLMRDVAGANARLVDECRTFPMLVPFGCVNPTLPGWEDDLRDCLGRHRMPGIRLHPGFHGYDLADPRFREIVAAATTAGCIVQVSIALEDVRTQPPAARAADVPLGPLPAALRDLPDARVQMLGWRPRAAELAVISGMGNVWFDTSRTEGTDGVATLCAAGAEQRVAFGTHAPFLIPEAALVRVGEAQLDRDAVVTVLGGAARRLRETGRPAAVADAAGRESRPANAVVDPPPGFGLPPIERLRRYRIWDSYFTPAYAHPGRDGLQSLLRDIERSWHAVEMGGFEKLCFFAHVGIGTTGDAAVEDLLRARPDLVTAPLDRRPERLLALLHLNANDVAASLDAIDRWIVDGPMVGVYLPGGGPGARVCTDPAVERLIRRVADRRGVIVQHTWLKAGGKQGAGESTPGELAELARRFPEQAFVCAHAGGEWEQGLRAVRGRPNVFVETSGFDATAGFVERAVRDLGAERIVFGSHLPGRSLGTELMKVLAADVSERDKGHILGANFRRLVEGALSRKR